MDEIFGLDFGEEVVGLMGIEACVLSAPSNPMVLLPRRLAMILSRWTNAPPTMKRMFCGVDLDIFLVRVLAAAFRGDVGDGPFDDFKEGLLHAFAGNIAGDGDVAGGFADFIDLIDVDDAHFCSGDVVVGGLDKAQDDIFDVFADIAGFGERGRIGNGKRDVEDVGKGAGNEGFSGACRAEEQHVGLAVLDFILFREGADPFIVVIDGDGDGFFGVVLTDHILVELLFDFFGLEKLEFMMDRFFFDNIQAEVDTFIADEGLGPEMSFSTASSVLPQKEQLADYLFFICHTFIILGRLFGLCGDFIDQSHRSRDSWVHVVVSF